MRVGSALWSILTLCFAFAAGVTLLNNVVGASFLLLLTAASAVVFVVVFTGGDRAYERRALNAARAQDIYIKVASWRLRPYIPGKGSIKWYLSFDDSASVLLIVDPHSPDLIMATKENIAKYIVLPDEDVNAFKPELESAA